MERRRAPDALLADCRQKKIDIVVVWKFDRFARSLTQLLSALELFRTLNIGFVSCTEAIDTSLPMARCCSKSSVRLPNGSVR